MRCLVVEKIEDIETSIGRWSLLMYCEGSLLCDTAGVETFLYHQP